MGKAGKWIKSFLTGKKEKDKKEKCANAATTNQNCSPLPTHDQNPTTPNSTPKEKKRWSFRRSSATSPASKDSIASEATVPTTPPPVHTTLDFTDTYEQKKHAMAVAAATAAVADAAAAAAQAAAAVIRLTEAASGKATAKEEAAAIKIQSVFRSYLARKALCALKGLVKLQALVRGHLVRKQAKATLRCMQALVTAQARARAQRIRMVEDGSSLNRRPSPGRRSVQDNRQRHTYNETDRGTEENIKIVEMDLGETKENAMCRNSYSNHAQTDRPDSRFSTQSTPNQRYSINPDNYSNVSPAPSVLTHDMSPGACSGHFQDFSFGTAQSSPQCYSAMSRLDPSRAPFAFPRPDYGEQLSYDYPLYPNYMANTQSSKAKARSQSAPKQRQPDAFERQPSKSRRASVEGRNHIPRAVKMQRSSSHVGSTAQNYQYPWYNNIKLDRSAASLMESECGSSSTVLTTNTNYCKSLAGYNTHGSRY